MTETPRIHFDHLALEADQSVSHEGRPFTGTAFEEFPDGGLRSEAQYVDGQMEGAVSDWYPSGTVRETAHWWRGARHGPTRLYDEGGRLLSEQEHEYGVQVARRTYGPEGEVLEDWTIGPDDNLYEILRLSRQRYANDG